MSKLSLSSDALKVWLHKKGLTKSDQLLLALGTFDQPCSMAQLLDRTEQAGVRAKSFSNPSASLARAKGLALRTPAGWEISEGGRQRLIDLGVESLAVGVAAVARDIRLHASKVPDEQTRAFLDEAIRCFEMRLHRSAVVMSWLAAVYTLQAYVVANRLTEFNAEAIRVDSRWRAAKSIDDLSRMKEADFFDRLVTISVVGKNVKQQLKVCLDLRNACGHPNSMKLGDNMVAAHIETLLLNVFTRFA